MKKVAARDLMPSVDLSGSMEAENFEDLSGTRISRLDAVRLVLDDFIERRENDRIGLIVFGSAAYLQAPFTEDHDAVRFLLHETRVRMAGPQTMLGDAIGFAISRFEDSTSSNRVLILLTDGNDTESRMPPATAAEIAAKYDITIHTIAMGDPTAVGEEKLDLDALRKIADATGGSFFEATDREELTSIYRELDTLVPGIHETLGWRPKRPLFHLSLAAGMVLLLLYETVMVLRSTWRERRPAHA